MLINDSTLEQARAEFVAPKTIFSNGEEFIERPLPYALFWRPSRITKGNQTTILNRLCAITLQGHNGTPAGIRYYCRKKGWKLIDYWTPDEPKFKDIREELNIMINYDPTKIQQLEADRSALLERVKELEAKELAKNRKRENESNQTS